MQQNTPERWEPPQSPTPAPARRRQLHRPDLTFSLFDLPEIWMALVVRLGITVFVLAGAMLEPIRDELTSLILVVIIGLLVLMIASRIQGFHLISSLTLIDALTLSLIVPLGVMNSFVSASPELSTTAEQSAYTETIVAMLGVTTFTAAICYWLTRSDSALRPAMLLPALTMLPLLALMLDDLRNQTILIALVLSFGLGILALIIGAMPPFVFIRWFPLFLFGLLIAGGFALDPGFDQIVDRGAPVATGHVFGILLMAVLLLLATIMPARGILPPPPGRRHGRTPSS